MSDLVKTGAASALRSLEEIEYLGRVLVVESPYAGDVPGNTEYARAICRGVLAQGGVPLASHLLYPQMLDDDTPGERASGILAGLEVGRRAADAALFAVDFGISKGMAQAAIWWLNHKADKPDFGIYCVALAPEKGLLMARAALWDRVRALATPERFKCAACNGYGYHQDGDEYAPVLRECEICGGAGSVQRWVMR